MRLVKPILTLVMAALVLGGCTGGRQLMEGQRRQVDGGERPAWVDNPDKEISKDVKCFPGLSRQFAMEADARNDARQNAYIQAVESMGIQGKRMFDQVASLVGASDDILTPGVVQDEMTRLKAEGVALGEIKQWHIERWEMVDSGALRQYFVAHCLYQVPRDAAKQFMENLLQTRAAAAEDDKVRENINRALEKMHELQTEW